jgi:hypothetical protein
MTFECSHWSADSDRQPSWSFQHLGVRSRVASGARGLDAPYIQRIACGESFSVSQDANFMPVTVVNSAPLLLVVHPSIAARSLPELMGRKRF